MFNLLSPRINIDKSVVDRKNWLGFDRGMVKESLQLIISFLNLSRFTFNEIHRIIDDSSRTAERSHLDFN